MQTGAVWYYCFMRQRKSSRRYHKRAMRTHHQFLDDVALTLEQWKTLGEPSMFEIQNKAKAAAKHHIKLPDK